MFILIDNEGLYWAGNGYYTRNVSQAKLYPTWQAANAACNRMKRRGFKFTSIEDLEDE